MYFQWRKYIVVQCVFMITGDSSVHLIHLLLFIDMLAFDKYAY